MHSSGLGPNRTLIVIVLAATPAVARAGAAPTAAELDALAVEVARLAQGDGASEPALLAGVLAAVPLDHDAACREAVREVGRGSAAVRAMAALHALEVCHSPCWQAFGKVASARQRIEAGPDFIAACEGAGPDPFPGAVAALRGEVEPTHLGLYRQLLGELRARLSAVGTPRARALWSTIERSLPAVAAGLVVVEREAHPPSSPPVAAPWDRAREAPPWPRAAAPLVVVSRGAVSVDGADAGQVDGRAATAQGFRVAALGARLERWRSAFAARHPSAPPPSRLVLRPDGDTPFSTLERLAFTAAQAGFVEVDAAVPVRDRRFRRVRWSGQPGAPLVLATQPPPPRVEWDDEAAAAGAATGPAVAGASVATASQPPGGDRPTLIVQAAGFTLTRRGHTVRQIPDTAGRPDDEELGKALTWLARQRGGPLWVSGDPAVPWRRVVDAVDLALGRGFEAFHILAEPPAEPAADAPPPRRPAESASATSLRLGGADDGKGPTIELGALGAEALAGPRSGTALLDLEPATVAGGLDEAAVRAVLAERMGELRGCYARELARAPRLAGKVVVQLVIGGGGGVATAAVRSSTLRNNAVESCLTSAARRFQFPMPEGGAAAVVTAPLKFYAAP